MRNKTFQSQGCGFEKADLGNIDLRSIADHAAELRSRYLAMFLRRALRAAMQAVSLKISTARNLDALAVDPAVVVRKQ